MTDSILAMKKSMSMKQFAEHLQGMGELFYWPAGKFWIVTEYELAREVLKDARMSADRSPFFISRMPELDLNLIGDFFAVVTRLMVMQDGDAHQKRRRMCYQGFSNAHLARITPKIQAAVTAIVDSIPAGVPFDFTKLFAESLPRIILSDFFRIPEPDRQLLAEHALTMTQFFGGASQYRNEDGIVVNKAAIFLQDYFGALLAERRRSPHDDFLSEMVRHQAHFGLDDDALVAQSIMMWLAGMVTTSDQMNHNALGLLEYARAPYLQAEEQMREDIIEELSRLDPAVTFTFRVATETLALRDKTIPKHSAIFIANHAVNRDAAAWQTPHAVNTEHTAKHFAYGFGSHYCLGAKLSVLMMRFSFDALLKRFPGLRVCDYARNHYSLSFSGFSSLMLCG